jgi:hypothetical protein
VVHNNGRALVVKGALVARSWRAGRTRSWRAGRARSWRAWKGALVARVVGHSWRAWQGARGAQEGALVAQERVRRKGALMARRKGALIAHSEKRAHWCAWKCTCACISVERACELRALRATFSLRRPGDASFSSVVPSGTGRARSCCQKVLLAMCSW